MKKERDVIDGTPSKRLFLSIIADYDINRSVCELIDNVLDIWNTNKRTIELKLNIELSEEQQTIRIEDNAGGIKEENLNSLVAPGVTLNDPKKEVIGLFGVGTKRAVVALGQEVKITTRYKADKSFRIEFDDAWLGTDDWHLPYYEVEDITPGSTIIELQKLRTKLDEQIITKLKSHLGATYSKFLTSNIKILINGEKIKAESFDNWAYPPDFSPNQYKGSLTVDSDKVEVEITGGLANQSSPASGEYGVYLYCNDRLIVRALKTYEVGFGKGQAGFPHPSISLMKVIVSLNGPAELMPWNSSKSGINTNNPIFIGIRKYLFEIVKEYSSLSRRLEGEWQDEVFRYKKGNINVLLVNNFEKIKNLHLPPLPIAKPRYIHVIKSANARISKKKPWVVGLYQSIIAVDLIAKQNLDQKNRICLIILDSTLEIGFKEFLIYESGGQYSNNRLSALFSNRHDVHNEIKKYKAISKRTWQKIDYYYNMRTKLVHEKAASQITDEDIEDYREVVEKVLKRFFGKLTF